MKSNNLYFRTQIYLDDSTLEPEVLFYMLHIHRWLPIDAQMKVKLLNIICSGSLLLYVILCHLFANECIPLLPDESLIELIDDFNKMCLYLSLFKYISETRISSTIILNYTIFNYYYICSTGMFNLIFHLEDMLSVHTCLLLRLDSYVFVCKKHYV